MSVEKPDKLIFNTKLKEERDYWVQRLSRDLGLSHPPFDYVRLGRDARETSSVPVSIAGELYQKLTRLTGQSSFLRYVALMTALKICLYKYTSDQAIVVGSPAFRGQEELNGTTNALVIVDEVDDQWSFRQLLLKVRETLLEAYARQSYPFHRLVKDLGLDGRESRCPLFNVVLALENIHTDVPDTGHDITIRLSEGPDEIRGHVEFNPSRYGQESIDRFVAHYLNILGAALKNYDAPIAALEMLTPPERHQLLVEWNGLQTDYRSDLCVHQLFEAQAAEKPDAVAVVVDKKWLTYGELNCRANQIAHHLQRLGVGPDVLVGICVERSPAMLVGLLGILKAGGAYVPLDPAYPPEHLADMLADAHVPVLVTESHLKDRLPEHQAQVVCLDQWAIRHSPFAIRNPDNGVGPDNLAYVIYTSGSTGKPKGVMVQHRSLVSFTETALADYALTPDDRVLQFATISFDASAEEIYPCLASGATLVLRTDGMLESISVFLQTCQEYGITVLDLPTVYWHEITALFGTGALTLPASVRLVIIGGERALPERLLAWQKHVSRVVRLANTYGPTEATVVATKWEPSETLDADAREVPIGRPIRNVQTYVLDGSGHPVPIGVPGEIYIGGDGVARGYLNRPELTAEKFIPNPFAQLRMADGGWRNEESKIQNPESKIQNGERLYKTGDLARYRPDGHIEFLGRVDHQVKIRGFRIELEEIETVLSQHAGVRETVVVAREDIPGDKRLVAYVVPDPESAPTVSELRRFLSQKLPDYMMPSLFMLLPALPLTPNGKVDRRALPVPNHARPDLEKPFVPPRTPTEALLAGIWAEVLGLERVGVDDNFFELGGNSLRTVQLAWKMSAALNHDIPIRLLFLHPTIAALAQALEKRSLVPEPMGQWVNGSMGQRGHQDIDSLTHLPVDLDLPPERRPFVSLLATGKIEMAPVDAVALGYLPNQLLAQSGLKREEIIHGWLDNCPTVDTVMETPHGRIASIILPRFGFDLYADQADLVGVIVQALEMAAQLGARTVSLTGLIPSATDYGQAILRATSGRTDLPAITTGHATTVATVVLTIRRMVEESGRNLAQERVGFLGLGSVGRATLGLMLKCLPHPAEIMLGDVYSKLDALQRIQHELISDFGFRGSVRVIETRTEVPPEFYEATLIVGATNAPDILDMARLRPGTMIVDDPAPHCFAPGEAIRRFQEQEDILFTEGDLLRSPVPIRIRQLITSRRHAEQILNAAGGEALTTHNQWNITSCVLSSLLSSRFEDLRPTIGLVDDEACWQNYERLNQLGFQVADLHCGRFVLAEKSIRNFRQRFGGTHRPSQRRLKGLGKLGWMKD